MADDLFEEHRKIHIAAEELVAALNRVPRIDLEDLNRYRVRLGCLIMRHKQTEEDQVFGPLFRDRWIDDMPYLEPVIRQIKDQKNCYSEVIRQWTPQAIMADWNGYVATVRVRVKAMAEMIQTEEDMVYRPVQLYRAQRHEGYLPAACI